MEELGRIRLYEGDRKFKTECWRRKDKTVEELGKIRLDGDGRKRLDGGVRKDKTGWRS